MSKLDTSRTVTEIQLALRNCYLFNQRSDIMVPNVSWGLLPYEADFVSVSRSGYMTEVEIKRSFQDFKKDFTKEHNHDDERVYRFYYCVPESIYEKVTAYLDEKYEGKSNYEKPAVLFYTETPDIGSRNYGNPYAMHKVGVKYRKLFLEEQLTVARLGQLRFWSYLEKTKNHEENDVQRQVLLDESSTVEIEDTDAACDIE